MCCWKYDDVAEVSAMSSGFLRPLVAQHVELPTQQRRLRHLHSLSARNLSIRGFGNTLLDSYFTLHLLSDIGNAFYRSETVHNSLNPEWRGFDPETFGILPIGHCIVVKVWCGKGTEEFRVALEWHVDLAALVHVGKYLFSGHSYSANTLLFGMFDSYYSAPEHDNLSEAVLFKSLRVPSIRCDQSQVRSCYSVSGLCRFRAVHRRLAHSNYRVRQAVTCIAKRMEEDKERCCMVEECERLRCQTKLFGEELARQKQCLAEEAAKLEQRREQLMAKKQQRATEDAACIASAAEQETLAQRLNLRRQLCRASLRSLKLTRSWLASDLLNVLPIVQISESQYTIVDVNLPPSESFAGCKELDLTASCGFVAQVVHNLSCILDVPLRHVIIFKGSRSLIRDDIPTKVINDERELCLYPRQRHERDDFFKVAMFLLNTNLVQLRQHVHLATSDPRRTLHNLKGLLDKLAVRCHRAEATLNITTSEGLPVCTFARPLPHMRLPRTVERGQRIVEVPLAGSGEESDDAIGSGESPAAGANHSIQAGSSYTSLHVQAVHDTDDPCAGLAAGGAHNGQDSALSSTSGAKVTSDVAVGASGS